MDCMRRRESACLTFMKFQRNFEAQADYLGSETYVCRRIRSAGLSAVLREGAGAGEKEAGLCGPRHLKCILLTPARMEHTQHEIAMILPARPQYVVDTSEFQDVKSRLAALENRRKVEQRQGQGAAACGELRRAEMAAGDGAGSSGDGTGLR